MSTPTGTPSGTPTDAAPPAPVDPPVKDGSLLGDRVIAGLTVALGAFLLVQAFGFPEPGQPEDPGTAALPRLIGAALVVLGIMLVFNSENNRFIPERGTRLRTACIVVASLAYTFALTPLGFMLSSLIFMVLGLLIMGIRSIVRLVLVPLVVTVAVYYLFTTALGVYLPSGIIEGIMP
ncbi:tripartite tricarboxylate transporter TctB family protein [Corynebacteriaceae bacterium 7-707]